jgi:tetratricopeptide (TPR) repeat protein
MHHYARAIAHATLGNFMEAEMEQLLFYETRNRIPESRKFFNNTALEILAVAKQMMEGELKYHRGNYAEAFDHLRKSVQLNDNLAYSEPWAWMHPPRHALGALLLEQGHHDEAESVYRADLGLDNRLQRCARHPGNIWSLHGLAECLRHRGETTVLEEISTQLDAAIARADTAITSSCCCRKNVA